MGSGPSSSRRSGTAISWSLILKRKEMPEQNDAQPTGDSPPKGPKVLPAASYSSPLHGINCIFVPCGYGGLPVSLGSCENAFSGRFRASDDF